MMHSSVSGLELMPGDDDHTQPMPPTTNTTVEQQNNEPSTSAANVEHDMEIDRATPDLFDFFENENDVQCCAANIGKQTGSKS